MKIISVRIIQVEDGRCSFLNVNHSKVIVCTENQDSPTEWRILKSTPVHWRPMEQTVSPL